MSGLCHLLHSLRGVNRPLCRRLAGKTMSHLSQSATLSSSQPHRMPHNPVEPVHLSGVWGDMCAGSGKSLGLPPKHKALSPLPPLP